jgi:hypothetical protein
LFKLHNWEFRAKARFGCAGRRLRAAVRNYLKPFALLTAVLSVLSIAACSEKLESGTSCPLLCPEQAISLRDTIVDAVFNDTTVLGLPPIGSETFLMLASHGDTLETRAIVRFDTLPQSYTARNSVDSTITAIDSALLVTPIVKPDSLHRPPGPITIEVYDVDTTATDTVSSILGTLFRPDRFLGSRTFQPDSLTDTLNIPISTDTVLNRVLNGTKLRVGFRLVVPAGHGYDLRLGSAQASEAVTLRIKASTDTAATPALVTPLSNTPPNQPFLSGPLADFSIVLRGLTTLGPNLLGTGGVPARRSLMYFNVPSHIIDSTTIVRASLLITQTPNRNVDVRDSLWVFANAVLAAPTVTNPSSVLQFIGSNGQFGLDSVRLAPKDSGQRSFELVGLVRTWRNNPTTTSPRAIALRSGVEGQAPGEIDFFSTKALAAVRPRLRITYVPQTSFGIP